VTFEIFQRSRSYYHPAGEPRITWSKGGELLINPTAREQFFDGWTHVLLGWDSQRRVVGLYQATSAEKPAYPIRRKAKGNIRTCVISASAFKRHCGLIDAGRLRLTPRHGDNPVWVELPLPEFV